MKKYGIIIFSVLMSMFLVLPLTVQAEEGKEGHMMKSSEGEHMMRAPGGSMGHHDWLSSLNLDEDVLQKMKEMRLNNKEKMIDLRTQIEKKGLEMEKVLMDKKLDFNKILSIHDEIATLRQKISRKKIEQKIEMYKLLPDDKKEGARKMFLQGFSDKKHRKPGMNNWRDKSGCNMGK